MKIFLIILLFSSVNFAFAQNSGVIKVRKKSSNLLTLNGYTDGAIQTQLICGGKGLYVTNSDRYKVTSFIISLESAKIIEMQLRGNIVIGEICDNIDYLKTGDIVYINSVIAIDNSTGKEVKMPSLRFEIRGSDIDSKKQRYNMLKD